MKVVLVTGDRTWPLSDYRHVEDVLHGADLVIVGCCPTGVDLIAREFCLGNDIMQPPMVADWKRLGRQAGPERNGRMVKLACEMRSDGIPVEAWAFPLLGSTGTTGCMKLLKAQAFDVRPGKGSYMPYFG